MDFFCAGDSSKDLFQGYIFKDFESKEILGQWSIGGKAGIPFIGRDVCFRRPNREKYQGRVILSIPQEKHITIVFVATSSVCRELGVGRYMSGVDFGKIFLSERLPEHYQANV